MSIDARLARWTAPLAATREEARAHASFDIVRSETAKLESPTGGVPDWNEVFRAADTYLAEVGRDLVVGAALASALAHREGASGVMLGAMTLTKLLSDAALTPPRPRARANALSWFVQRAEVALDASKESGRTTLETLDATLVDLARAAEASLGQDAPSVSGVRERVRRALESLPLPTAASPPTASAAVFAQPPPAPNAAPTDTLPDRAEQVPSFVRRSAALLVQSAGLVRAMSALDADALRLTLVALYLPITSAPDTTRDARTALTAPPKLVLESLRNQQASATPELVVRDALAALERNRFALDLHATLAHALERAGATSAANVQRHEVVGLVTRLPELTRREFADGTPFAAPETCALFESWSAPARPARPVTPDSPSISDEMHALARRGRAADALELGSRARGAVTSGRERFEVTLALATIAENARATPLANELHATLLDEIDRHALDAWDPALAATALGAHLRSLRATAPSEPMSRTLFARLARIDPKAAFEISSAPQATPTKAGR